MGFDDCTASGDSVAEKRPAPQQPSHPPPSKQARAFPTAGSYSGGAGDYGDYGDSGYDDSTAGSYGYSGASAYGKGAGYGGCDGGGKGAVYAGKSYLGKGDGY